MPKNKTRKTVAGMVEEKLLQMIEYSDLPPWRKPWAFAGVDVSLSGRVFERTNALILAMTRAVMGYKSRVWLTHSDVERLNGKKWDEKKRTFVRNPESKNNPIHHIRQGAKGVPVIFNHSYVHINRNTGEPYLDEDGEKVIRWKQDKVYYFNADDIVGFNPAPFEPDTPVSEKIPVSSCREFLDRITELYDGAPEILHTGKEAIYYPDDDIVYLPPADRFISVGEYASTLIHELAHSTGHNSRLARNFDGTFGDKDYSREELVAEFASAIVLAHFGIDSKPVVENHAAYLKSWYARLKSSPGMLMDAMRDAEAAADMILGRSVKKLPKAG